MSHSNFDITSEEARRIADAMKDPEFRKLLREYADEISNPESLRKREEELAMLEAESNGSVELIMPKPGFCFKTKGSKGKTFVNVASNEKVDVAKSTPIKKGANGESGNSWSIPYSLAHPRSDKDTAGELCQVYDFVVSPATIDLVEKDFRFRNLIVDTAIEAIEKGFQDKLDKDVIYMKQMKYKGVPVSAVFRRNPSKESPLSEMEKALGKSTKDDDILDNEQKYRPQPRPPSNSKPSNTQTSSSLYDGPQEPKFTVMHRGEIDLHHYTNTRYHQVPSRPKELIVNIELPTLISSRGVDVEVEGRRLFLEKLPEYRLETILPFEVNSEEGSAKFDKTKHALILTLPVLPAKEITPAVSEGPVAEYMHINRHGGLMSHEKYDDGSDGLDAIEGNKVKDHDQASTMTPEDVRDTKEPLLETNDEPTGFETDPENDLQYIPSTIEYYSTKILDDYGESQGHHVALEEGHRLDVEPLMSLRGFIPGSMDDCINGEDPASNVSDTAEIKNSIQPGFVEQVYGLNLRSVSGETIQFASSAVFDLEED